MRNVTREEFIEAFFWGTVVLVVATFPTLLSTIVAAEQEPEEPKPYHMTFKVPRLEVPDVSPVFEIKANYEKAGKVLGNHQDLMTVINTIEIPKTSMVLTELGTYYITGYTSIECGGSTMTASGATCHKASYANRITQPTTCAIDPALHDFGDLFYIAEFDTVYVAEDTGSAVKGKHLDLYFWDDEYGYALSITGYYTVYAVEYVEGTYQPGDYDIRKQVTDKVIGWKIKGS